MEFKGLRICIAIHSFKTEKTLIELGDAETIIDLIALLSGSSSSAGYTYATSLSEQVVRDGFVTALYSAVILDGIANTFFMTISPNVDLDRFDSLEFYTGFSANRISSSFTVAVKDFIATIYILLETL